MAFTDECNPIEDMVALLKEKWEEYEDCPRPEIMAANETDDPRQMMNFGPHDAVVVKMEGVEQLRQRGNFEYYDRICPLIIEAWTSESRQRLWNLIKMIRAICNDNKHDFPDYHLIRYSGYTEMMEENLKIWKGSFKLTLESHCICVDTLT